MSAEPKQPARRPTGRWWWVVGLAIAAVVVIVLAPLASADPDGLERVAEDTGFLEAARDALYNIFPDYTLPFIDDPVISTVAAGLVGVALVFAGAWLIGKLLARRRGTTAGTEAR